MTLNDFHGRRDFLDRPTPVALQVLLPPSRTPTDFYAFIKLLLVITNHDTFSSVCFHR